MSRFAGRALLAVALAVTSSLVAAGAASATTYTVTTTADTTGGSCVPGSCSLRQAVATAQTGDTIIVPAGTYTLSNGVLEVETGVTIDGAGQGATVLMGSGSDPVASIDNASGPVVLAELTITGGNDTADFGGGGIFEASGSLTLDSVTVTGNTNTPSTLQCSMNEDFCTDSGGGGITSAGGSLVLNDSTVSDNTVNVAESNGDSGGGGILIGGGDLTLNDSTVSGNTASVTANVPGEKTDNNGGGGIYMDGNDLTISNSTVSANTVTVTGSGQPEPADGGGGIYQFGDNMRIENSTISGNVAHGPGVDKGGGGGVFDDGNSSQYLNDTIVNNSTDEPASVSTPPDSDGGGGLLFDGVSAGVVIANSTITGNSASQAAGGGINNNLDSTIEVTDSIIAGNTASAGAGGNCDSQPAPGNAIVSQGYNLTDDSASDNTCSLTGPGDILGANPDLGGLADNGGPTQTEALLPGSPAIDAGDPSGCTDLVGNPLTTDQRGVARPQPPGGRCDIGAYERALPVVSTGAPLAGQNNAVLTATAANPDPRDGTVSFQYGPTAAYGSATPAQTLAGGSGSQTYVQLLSGLAPGTYHFRVVASNPDGTSVGTDGVFAVSGPPPPSVTTANPAPVGSYTATLNGVSNPDGQQTTVHFEYGSNGVFSSSTAPQTIGAGRSDSLVSAKISGLEPRHTYQVRLVATSSAGTTTGSAVTFRTGAKLRPSSLGAKVKPHSDAKAPFVFKVSGKLKLPSGVSRSAGCRGSVSLKALVGKSKFGGARAKVGRLCGYRMKVTLHGPRLGPAGMARLLVAFGGNTMLASSKAAPLVVHFG